MPATVQQDGDTYFVQPEGSDERIELALDGFVSAEEVKGSYVAKSHFESEIGRRVAAAKKGLVAREELIGDESILDDVIAGHRDTLVERLGVKAGTTEADIERIRAQVLKKEVEPLKSSLENATSTIGRLREKSFKADYAQAARDMGIEDEMVDLVEMWVRQRVGYDEELDDFVVLDKDGKPELASGDVKGRRHPYMVASDLLRDIEASGEKKSWFRARRKSGGDYQPGARGGITAEDFSKMDDAARMKLYAEDRELWQEMTNALRSAGEARLGLR